MGLAFGREESLLGLAEDSVVLNWELEIEERCSADPSESLDVRRAGHHLMLEGGEETLQAEECRCPR